MASELKSPAESFTESLNNLDPSRLYSIRTAATLTPAEVSAVRTVVLLAGQLIVKNESIQDALAVVMKASGPQRPTSPNKHDREQVFMLLAFPFKVNCSDMLTGHASYPPHHDITIHRSHIFNLAHHLAQDPDSQTSFNHLFYVTVILLHEFAYLIRTKNFNTNLERASPPSLAPKVSKYGQLKIWKDPSMFKVNQNQSDLDHDENSDDGSDDDSDDNSDSNESEDDSNSTAQEVQILREGEAGFWFEEEVFGGEVGYTAKMPKDDVYKIKRILIETAEIDKSGHASRLRVVDPTQIASVIRTGILPTPLAGKRFSGKVAVGTQICLRAQGKCMKY
ncbi:hypothetical protein BT96DRAFT_1023705 [Gymnopus androsaceus JB14]|uniref:Uncharacterized protein n=1 Tax=Gymnopus androsaceus JB14 TaxID=1447944 RepID=A0A6A4H1V3_9AGAR|nr:hypothetical protein BT96DRAFT_1023705 [Gymnopus androsaceus JB14]